MSYRNDKALVKRMRRMQKALRKRGQEHKDLSDQIRSNCRAVISIDCVYEGWSGVEALDPDKQDLWRYLDPSGNPHSTAWEIGKKMRLNKPGATMRNKREPVKAPAMSMKSSNLKGIQSFLFNQSRDHEKMAVHFFGIAEGLDQLITYAQKGARKEAEWRRRTRRLSG